MDAFHRRRRPNPIASALTLFCLLLCAAPDTTASLELSPPSSALLAAEMLHARGYSHFATLMVALSTVSANFSGTVLAPPDFAFSSATASLLSNRRRPPRPSIALLLYHTLRPHIVLTWPALASRDNADELRTLFDNCCLYAFRSPIGGDVSISSSPNNNPSVTVQIRQPDLFVDDHLAVHGIDGVLDPSFATKCSSVPPGVHPVAGPAPHRQANRTLLDHAMRGLRRSGYSVVAAAMAVRRLELLALTSVTIFAISDKNLFLQPDGFRYDFRHHVVPTRRRFGDLARLTEGRMSFLTLAETKTVLVDSIDGTVIVDGIPVDAKEIYHNRWIVVLSIEMSLDEVVSDSQTISSITSQNSDYFAPSLPPIAGVSESDSSLVFLPPLPPIFEIPDPIVLSETFPTDSTGFNSSTGAPPTARELDREPLNSPATDDKQCVKSIGIEGSDLFCSIGTAARRMQEMEGLSGADVDESKPSIAYAKDLTKPEKVRVVENVNIADDVFFYI